MSSAIVFALSSALKVDTEATIDVTKVTGASLFFETDSSRLLF